MDKRDGGKKMRRVTLKKARPEQELKKGQLLLVAAPPYYKKHYLYEVTGAGGKAVRAVLYHSPTVRKSWSQEEFWLLFDMGVIKLADPSSIPPAPAVSDID